MECVDGCKRLPSLAVIDHPKEGKVAGCEVVESKVEVDGATAGADVEDIHILVELGCVVKSSG